MPVLLRQRLRQAEFIDQPDFAPDQHVQALRGLERINRWSRSAHMLWPGLRAASVAAAGRPLRVLDIATGAGDVPLQLWRKARQAGLAIELEGCDRSLVALEHARRRAAEQGAAVTFFPCDVLREPLPGTYDVIVSSLFLHHLAEGEALQLLRTMGQAARMGIMINDLRRSTGGWWLAYFGTRVLSASYAVHHDGPVSVAAAFTCSEALALARQAGLHGAYARRRWPFRFLLSWWREGCGES